MSMVNAPSVSNSGHEPEVHLLRARQGFNLVPVGGSAVRLSFAVGCGNPHCLFQKACGRMGNEMRLTGQQSQPA